MIKAVINFFRRIFENEDDRRERERIKELRNFLNYIKNHPEIENQFKKRDPQQTPEE